MDSSFWQRRWQRGEIGWHQDEINRHLAEHWPQLGVPATTRVFVPLCGKARDLLWLAAQGHRVLGVEISDLAAEAFISENRLDAQRSNTGAFQRLDAGDIVLLVGDYFSLQPHQLDDVGAVYDRASLIALPPDQRPNYVRKLARLLAPGTRSLLITIDYDPRRMKGPPFAVSDAEVHQLYRQAFQVTHLGDHDVLAEEPGWRRRGLDWMTEHLYALTRR